MAEDARKTVTDLLEGEAIRRALDGSDALLALLLRRRMPEIYGNQKYTRPRPQSEKPIRSMVNVAELLGPDEEPDE